MKNYLGKTKTGSRFPTLGRSMIEMLGVLAIIGVLSVGGLYAYSQAMEKHRINQASNFIPYAYMAMRELCTKSNCALKISGGDGVNYKYNRNLLCSVIGYDKAVCDGGGWGRLYGLKHGKEVTGWINYVSGNDFYLVFSNASPDLCAAIVSTNLPVYNIAVSQNPTITGKNAPLTPAQKETLKAQCYAADYYPSSGFPRVALWWQRE